MAVQHKFAQLASRVLPYRDPARPNEDGEYWYWGHPTKEDGTVDTDVSTWLMSTRNPRRSAGFISFERPEQPQYASKMIQAVMERSVDLELWEQAFVDKGEHALNHLQTTVLINSGHTAELIMKLLSRIQELENE
jgi:hypothetical protein